MTQRSQPTFVYHFTHIDHLPTLVGQGLLSDNAAHASGVLSVEVGNTSIKDRRRGQSVPFSDGGAVADYVPFYFAPRSPMMFAIANGNVPTYQGGTSRLIYLVTTLEQLCTDGVLPLVTDRNAALKYAGYRKFDLSDSLDDGFVDWDLMQARYWNDYDDGRERRMAECLIRESVAWESVTEIGTQNQVVANETSSILAAAHSSIPVNVRPGWYF